MGSRLFSISDKGIGGSFLGGQGSFILKKSTEPLLFCSNSRKIGASPNMSYLFPCPLPINAKKINHYNVKQMFWDFFSPKWRLISLSRLNGERVSIKSREDYKLVIIVIMRYYLHQFQKNHSRPHSEQTTYWGEHFELDKKILFQKRVKKLIFIRIFTSM